ncbi:YIP1 family protein [Halostella litorea]|uniref:YIP1 family protein n=1 Tax=Halostella litorea TaxID=2528831 RepID=UPI0010931F20|nr:YIP1 family protein [Halostella litorea]
MTQWIENPTGGRARGPAALVRAWFEVLTRPTRFFRSAVAPGDQAPGLVFAVAVVLLEEFVRFALVADAYPVLADQRLLSGVLWLGVAVLLVAPAALHLTAALQTVILVPLVDDRAGVSETVQTIAYSAAPCVVAGVPVPEVSVLCGAYGAVLLALGTATVHGTTGKRAALVSAVPAAVVFGYGFRAFAAAETLLRQWYII